jgi:hypothetical protein
LKKLSYRKQIRDALPSSCRLLPVLAALVLYALFPAGAHAIVLDGASRSYLQTRETQGAADLLPGYEYFNFSVRDAGREELSADFGGWARYDFNQETSANDVQYAYVSYQRKYDNSTVRLGRVMIFEGAAEAERVDGIYARTDILGPALGITAYGGVPAETDIDTPGNNVIYGARLYHRRENVYEIGVSGLKEEKNDGAFRKDFGTDLWLKPAGKIELLGKSLYDDVDKEWSEHAYNLVLGPFDKIRLNTQMSRYDYSAYLRTATTSALNINSGLLDPNETVFTIGEEVSYAASDRLTVYGQYALYAYKQSGNASSYGARVNYSATKQNAAGVSVNRMDGDEDQQRYTQFRVYGARMIGKAVVAVDLIDVALDRNIGGEHHVYSAVLAAAYDLSRSFRIGADVEYVNSPFSSEEVKAFAKIIYMFGPRIGGGGL